MTVKQLRSMLSADDDDLPVLAWPKMPGTDMGEMLFRIAGVRRRLDPDTAEDIVVLECDQTDD